MVITQIYNSAEQNRIQVSRQGFQGNMIKEEQKENNYGSYMFLAKVSSNNMGNWDSQVR